MTQKDALEILKMGENCFITGAAGSGKTHLLNEYIKFLKSHGVEVGITASTGIAATHMGGMTIHSWSGLGIKNHLTEYDLEELETKKYLQDRLKNTSVLIIDEISMLDHRRFDMVEKIARHLKKNQLPFGGMQVILCGDFFQLPPVQKAGELDSFFPFKSETWKELNLKICYLEEQYRHKDEKFLKILNGIRKNYLSDELVSILKSRLNAGLLSEIEPTKLHTHNIDVDGINDAELNKLPGELFVFTMSEKGKKPLVDALKKSCLAPGALRLKVGAKVMFVKNNFDEGYANGTLGKVIECSYDGPKVMTSGGKIKPEKVSWVIEEEGKRKAMIEQYPLRLAWAITVHKSQGMSLDAVEVDLSKSFEKGMGYVALSRVRTLLGLRLVGLNKNALEVREDIIIFDEDLQDLSNKDKAWLYSMSDTEVKEREKEFLEKVAPEEGRGGNFAAKRRGKISARRISPIEQTKNMLKEGMGLKEILEHRGIKLGTLLDHIEKILKDDPDFNVNHLKNEVSSGKFKKIFMAFRDMYGENRDFLLAPIKNKLGEGFSYEELRIVRLFAKKGLA